MGDPDQKYRRQTRRKNWVAKKRERNFVAKALWEDGRFRHKVNTKTLEVRNNEDEDWEEELRDYLSEGYCVPRRR